jgi:hypothetical protein
VIEEGLEEANEYADDAVATHNNSTTAHSDIRQAITTAVDGKANKIEYPTIEWDPENFNVPAGRTLHFDTAKTPVLTGTGLDMIALFAQVNGNPNLMFGFYSNDGGVTTIAGLFHVEGGAFVSDIELYNGTAWLNEGDYLLRYGITGDMYQFIGEGVTLAGFDIATDISVPDIVTKDLSDVYDEMLRRQHELDLKKANREAIYTREETRELLDEVKSATYHFVGYANIIEPTGGGLKNGDLWYNGSVLPDTAFAVYTYNNGSWSTETTQYEHVMFDLWSNQTDGHGYYWFNNEWNKIDQNVDLSAYRTALQQDAIDAGKVDKEEGKGLSEANYTATEKNKLGGIADGATKNEIATEEEAIAGTNDTKVMTPLKTKLAIDALGGGSSGGGGESESGSVSPEYTYIVDSDQKLVDWSKNVRTNGQDYTSVLIAKGEWTLTINSNMGYFIRLTTTGTKRVTGAAGSKLVFQNTYPSPSGAYGIYGHITTGGNSIYPNTEMYNDNSKDYSITGVTIDLSSAKNACGFQNCENLTNCTCYSNSGSSGNSNSYGFSNCINLANCNGYGYNYERSTNINNYYSFYQCINLSNCKGYGTGGNVANSYGKCYGFYSCMRLINCIGLNESNGQASNEYYGTGCGFYNCEYLTGCTGRSKWNAINYGFLNCKNITNCLGHSYTDSWEQSYGFKDCTDISNCIGYGRSLYGSYSHGFYNCVNVSNCTGEGSGASDNRTEGSSGFYNCSNIANCTGSAAGYNNSGFSSCHRLSFCKPASTYTGTTYLNCTVGATSGTPADTAEGGWNLTT